MNLYNKKYLYVNGSSISAGGGFEEYHNRQDVRDAYSNTHDNLILPQNQMECSYPYFLSKRMGVELINDSKSGSGVDRLVRTTLTFIEENKDKIHDTLILLEPQFGVRLDFWVNEWDDYGILNASREPGKSWQFTLVRDWFTDDTQEQNDWNEKYKKDIDSYMNNFFNPENQYNDEANKLKLLIGYLNTLKIDYLISLPNHLPDNIQNYFKENCPKSSYLNNKMKSCIWEYAKEKKWLISDETSNGDNHIGFFGNKNMADDIYLSLHDKFKLNVYSIHNNILNQFHLLFGSKNIEFNYIKPDEIERNDYFVFLDDLDCWSLKGYINDETSYGKIISNKYKWIYDIPNHTQKNYLIILNQEMLNFYEFNLLKNSIYNEFDIHPSKIFFIDACISSHPNSNKAPLQSKMKMFNLFKIDDFKNINSKRYKKFTFLSNKLKIDRLYIMDSILYFYNDYKKLKIENNISFVESENIIDKIKWILGQSYDDCNQLLKNNLKSYTEIDLPWEIDTNPNSDKTVRDVYISVYNIYRNSFFSIVSETDNFDYALKSPEEYDDGIQYQQQISEKSIISILSGNLPFIIVDSFFYKQLESIGFDFSYLKNTFDIDYSTNTKIENIKDIDKFVLLLKDMSLEEVSNLYEKNRNIINNNIKIMFDIFFGDLSDDEIKFLNKLMGKI